MRLCLLIVGLFFAPASFAVSPITSLEGVENFELRLNTISYQGAPGRTVYHSGHQSAADLTLEGSPSGAKLRLEENLRQNVVQTLRHQAIGSNHVIATLSLYYEGEIEPREFDLDQKGLLLLLESPKSAAQKVDLTLPGHCVKYL